MIDLLNLGRSPEWMADALCARVDPDLWFPEEGQSGAPARLICARCPVGGPCAEFATGGRESGIWAGVSRAVVLDPDDVDEVVVARLVAGQPVTGPSRLELAWAAVRLHERVGWGERRIAERLGVHERQVHRWLARHRADQPLCPTSAPRSPRVGAA